MLGFVSEVVAMAEAKLGDKCSRKALSVLAKRGLNYDGEVHEKTDGLRVPTQTSRVRE